MKKGNLSLLLTLVLLVVSIMPAFGESAFDGERIVDEPITLTIMQSSYETRQVDTEDTMWFYDELEKMTGIHVKWDYVAESEWNTRINLMAASKEYPDVIARGKLDIEEYGVLQGILVPLDDLIPQYMPNYYERLQMNNANASIPASDGKTYYIGNLIAQNINHEPNHFINMQWLNALELEVPETIEELTEVLIAFRDGDPNGNGEADELPLSASDLTNATQGVYSHFANFGVPLTDLLYVNITEDQEVVFSADMPGFRAACEWLNMCYTEGLMDPESLTQDVSTWGAKVNDGKVGYTTYLRRLNSMWNADAVNNFASLIPPASEYGVSVPMLLEVPDIGAAITIANEHVEETLRWIDAQLETEIMMVAYNGPIKEGGPIEPTMIINESGKYEVTYVPADNALYDYCPVLGAQFFAPGDYYFEIYEMAPHRIERFENSKAYAEAGVLEPYSYYYLSKFAKMSNEDALEVAQLYVDIQKFMREAITNFITQGVTDAGWDEFLASADNLGIDRYVELYQAAYDNYLAKNN
ncbi:MAG: extracellular solute-binding protein [Clostridia bacterium]|nr:extracellular solute-binding protein [Clostridia bacterium]